MRLPAGGRRGRVPAWPLSAATAEERACWRELWRLPQAVEWERIGLPRIVAVFCRLEVKAERGDLRAAGEARLRGDQLGLTPMALARLGWEVVDEPKPSRALVSEPYLLIRKPGDPLRLYDDLHVNATDRGEPA